MGLEPTTLWTTTRCSNQLSYDRHETISPGILPGFRRAIQVTSGAWDRCFPPG